MNTPIGRDGRPLVTTTQAAYSLGMKPGQFREWARRRSITPAGRRPSGGPGPGEGLWDLAALHDAVLGKQPTA
ncbi:hypothetical protein [Streptomyces scopuliridis]|uniref:hypothetical protein n=1 Tax=Streptomyces scopuliridis TaxID=452529 RepID=UPI00341A4AFC